MAKEGINRDFADNLRLLCGHYRSIAEVCRRLSINRPQFNRYLSGQYKPSAHQMRRICDFFGVEEHEILMPHSRFAQLIRVRPRQPETPVAPPYQEHVERLLRAGSASFEPYLGYYFETYYSMAYPGRILRTLVHFRSEEGGIYYRRSERASRHATRERTYHGKYLGMAFLLTDRIFMVDYESLTGNQITETILYPSFKNRIARLTGIRIDAAASGLRVLSGTRVVYDFLGRQINLREAWRMCGLFDADDPAIDEDTREAISNVMQAGEWHFSAYPR